MGFGHSSCALRRRGGERRPQVLCIRVKLDNIFMCPDIFTSTLILSQVIAQVQDSKPPRSVQMNCKVSTTASSILATSITFWTIKCPTYERFICTCKLVRRASPDVGRARRCCPTSANAALLPSSPRLVDRPHPTMSSPGFPFFKCSGTPHAVGLSHGTQARALIARTIAAYRTIFQEMAHLSWDASLAIAHEFLPLLPTEFVDEMRGVADGAGVPLLEIVALNCRSE